MDYLRTCYLTRMRLWQDDREEVEVYWFRCLPRARHFLGANRFTSTVFRMDKPGWYQRILPTDVGEVSQAPGPYDVGRNALPLRGQMYCGRGEAFGTGGIHGVDVPFNTGAAGDNPCCYRAVQPDYPFLTPETKTVALGVTIFDSLFFGALDLPLFGPGPLHNVDLPDRAPLYLLKPDRDLSVSGFDGDDIRQVIWVNNPTEFTVTLLHLAAGSHAENQFRLPDASDLEIPPGAGFGLWNDGDGSGWRALDQGGGGGGASRQLAETIGPPSTQTVPNTGAYFVVWEGLDYDDEPATSDPPPVWIDPSDPTKIVAPEDGWYWVGVTICWLNNSVGGSRAIILESSSSGGNSIASDSRLQDTGSNCTVQNISGLTFMRAGDYVRVIAELNSATGDSTIVGTGVLTTYQTADTKLHIFKVQSSGAAGPPPPGTPGGATGDIQYNAGGGFFGGVDHVGPSHGGTGLDTSADTGVLHVTAGTWSAGPVDLAVEVTGDLPVANLAGGVGANAATYWRGDGTWDTPSGGGGGAPGGIAQDVQFNDGFTFAGSGGFFTYDATARRVAVTDSGRIATLNTGSAAVRGEQGGSFAGELGQAGAAGGFTDGANTVTVCDATHALVAVGPVAINGPIWTNQTSFGTTLGTVTQRLPVYDATGTLLGYLPVYDTIA